MLAFLLELLLQLLVEALFQFVAELLFELGFEAIAHSVRRGRSANPVFAAVGLFIIGGLVGFVTCWALSHPLLRPGCPFPAAQSRPRATCDRSGYARIWGLAARKRW